MGSYYCNCGNKIRLTEDNDNEMYLITYTLIQEMEERMDNNDLTADEMNTIIVDETDATIYCDKCKRLHVERNKERKTYVYAVEEIVPYDDERNERLDTIYGPRQ